MSHTLSIYNKWLTVLQYFSKSEQCQSINVQHDTCYSLGIGAFSYTKADGTKYEPQLTDLS